MTTEQKAKAYDEAVKEASIAYKDEDKHLKATLERIFPELKESEDERIRKAIMEFFELQDDNTTYSFIPKKDILAWLEKQEYLENYDEAEKEKTEFVGERIWNLKGGAYLDYCYRVKPILNKRIAWYKKKQVKESLKSL